MDNVTQAYAHVLKRTRKSRFLSQSELALESGLDRSFISMLERGVRQPSLQTLFILAKALKVQPSEMIQQVESKSRRMQRLGSNRLPSNRV